MRDFIISRYKELILAFISKDYYFQPYCEYITAPQQKTVILRHDVDAYPENSLIFAKIQADLGIIGSYYFRNVTKSFNVKKIKQIAALGHEIGYHYENLDLTNGDLDKAYENFCLTLAKFRKIANIATITMHGRPLSKFDNRDLWKKYEYRSLGIIGEPYMDMNFNEVFYLTDTGRRWDGRSYTIYDKTTEENPLTNPEYLQLKYHSTNDIINSIQSGSFPSKAMITFHPQRWSNNLIPWLQELIGQNLENAVKNRLIRK